MRNYRVVGLLLHYDQSLYRSLVGVRQLAVARNVSVFSFVTRRLISIAKFGYTFVYGPTREMRNHAYMITHIAYSKNNRAAKRISCCVYFVNISST